MQEVRLRKPWTVELEITRPRRKLRYKTGWEHRIEAAIEASTICVPNLHRGAPTLLLLENFDSGSYQLYRRYFVQEQIVQALSAKTATRPIQRLSYRYRRVVESMLMDEGSPRLRS
ncbi:hypothetical protein XI07_18350 [Bradyrhizobium sp. CCBAU 11445]|nr:hypothetical protein [Bradyrhizobium sp. CCBAU 25360]MDA9483941.1 hypothetical protein [Bradyrhizobium sp. CCBAU 11445]